MRKFAIVAAAGELAAPITGWEPGTSIDAAVYCFKAWLANRGGADKSFDSEAALSQIRRILQSESNRFSYGGAPILGPDPNASSGQRTAHSQMGYWLHQKIDGHQVKIYYFDTEPFKEYACKGFNPTEVAKALKDAGHLLADESRTDGFQKQVKIPKIGKNRRYYAVKETILDD
jgi:hypothetical protein